MRKYIFLTVVLFLPAACGYVSEYEEAVYDREPLYCYKTIGGIECHKTPNNRDEKHLVNYFGPHPSRYDKPAAAPPPNLSPPPPVDFYVRDPEPVPKPSKAVSMKANEEDGKALTP